jgi:NADH-quinone oxidoreductase subunit C
MANSGLTNDAFYKELQDKFPDKISNKEEQFGLLTADVDSKSLLPIIKWMKESTSINYLTLIGGVHYPEVEGKEYAVVYHLHSLTENFRIRLKAYLSKDDLTIESITSIFSGANWLERETFDFYGIKFKGHPNLKRILNEDSMDYHPMRREYQLEDATREDKDDTFFGR